jgi:hypothetical protein
MDDLRLFLPNQKSSEHPSSNAPREYLVYVFFFVAVTAILAVWTHWVVPAADMGIRTEVLSGLYCADWLIGQFRKRS